MRACDPGATVAVNSALADSAVVAERPESVRRGRPLAAWLDD
jgi:hypothetical protein